MKRLDWAAIWAKFDEAYQKALDSIEPCLKCGHTDWANDLEWEDQQKLIQRIVNKAMAGK